VLLRFRRFAMACSFELILTGADRDYLEQVAGVVLDEVESLDRKLSCFNPTSEVSYLNREATRRFVIVSPELFEVIRLARRVWEETEGAFDVTAGPLIALWREAERTGVGPTKDALDSVLQRIGMQHVLIDETSNSVRFVVDGIGLNLGAIGKGYAVKRAAEILRDYDIKYALISAGGSTVYGLADVCGHAGWRVGIRHPSRFDERIAEVTLRSQAVSTSGGPLQRDPVVKERFEHIFDPRTGLPAKGGLASASVVAEDAALSDALATAFYMLGVRFAESYCRVNEGVRAVLVEAVKGSEAFSVRRIP